MYLERKGAKIIMEKPSVLRTLKFIFSSLLILGLIFVGVGMTVLNVYKPTFKTYINGEFIGYFTSSQQFDEVYNDLVVEKQNIDENVKVYLTGEPEFKESYIRESLLEDQNIYTNLRAAIKTEYTLYKVAVNNEEKMIFNTQDEANTYAEKLKSEVKTVTVNIKEEKVEELGELTTIERADAIYKDIVDRNKPVETPKVTYTYTPATTTNKTASSAVANVAAAQGGIWPTISRYVTCHYGGYYGHTGTDIAGKVGNPIYAYKSGLVTYAGWSSGGYGYMVKIDHGNGISTLYAHCSKVLVKAGQEVTMGETIALLGSTGYSTGPHLHFEIRINGVAVNAYPYIQGK